MVGVAVKVTFVPEQIGPLGTAAMETETGKIGFTAIFMTFEVAGFPVIQVRDEFITQLTKSPLESALLEYVGKLLPTFTPFNFH